MNVGSPLSRRNPKALLGLAGLACLVALSEARGEEVVWTDPPGDEHGPGTFVLPTVQGFRKGTFDLREIRLKAVPEGVEVWVTWQSAPEPVSMRTRVGSSHREVRLPVVDLYLQDPEEPGPGHREVLPGRRVVLADPRGWHRGIVLSSLPEVLEAHYRRAVPDLAKDLCFPLGTRWSGRTMVARVPERCLPRRWSGTGALVLVTALGPGGGFQGLARGKDAPVAWDAEDPYVRRADAVVGQCNVWEDGLGASPCAIGGCDPCRGRPFVLDLLAPEGQSQEALLAAGGPDHPAALPLVFPAGVPPAPEGGLVRSPPPLPRLPVVSVREETLSLRLPDGVDGQPWPPGTLGALVCPGERPGGTVVVRGSAGGYLIVDRLPDGRAPCPDGEVVF